MNEEHIKKIAAEAVEAAQSNYGRGWERISHDARVGAAVPSAIQMFRVYSPNAPASDVAAVVAAIIEMVKEGGE